MSIRDSIIGLGYRIKDLRSNSNMAGPSKRIVSELNMKADVAVRENKTIIRYLDLENNQVTSGQTIWGIKYSADYAFSKNLTGIFYFDYTFSKYAISTAFPQTTIRSGFTLSLIHISGNSTVRNLGKLILAVQILGLKNFSEEITSVSYTHLDVYKRQELSRKNCTTTIP